MQNTGYLQIENMIQKIFVARGQRNSLNEAWEICKRCNKVASCFFLIRSSVERYKLNETERFSRVEDFSFSMSPRDLYYQFYKNAPCGSPFSIFYGHFIAILWLFLAQNGNIWPQAVPATPDWLNIG